MCRGSNLGSNVCVFLVKERQEILPFGNGAVSEDTRWRANHTINGAEQDSWMMTIFHYQIREKGPCILTVFWSVNILHFRKSYETCSLLDFQFFSALLPFSWWVWSFSHGWESDLFFLILNGAIESRVDLLLFQHLTSSSIFCVLDEVKACSDARNASEQQSLS